MASKIAQGQLKEGGKTRSRRRPCVLVPLRPLPCVRSPLYRLETDFRMHNIDIDTRRVNVLVLSLSLSLSPVPMTAVWQLLLLLPARACPPSATPAQTPAQTPGSSSSLPNRRSRRNSPFTKVPTENGSSSSSSSSLTPPLEAAAHFFPSFPPLDTHFGPLGLGSQAAGQLHSQADSHLLVPPRRGRHDHAHRECHVQQAAGRPHTWSGTRPRPPKSMDGSSSISMACVLSLSLASSCAANRNGFVSSSSACVVTKERLRNKERSLGELLLQWTRSRSQKDTNCLEEEEQTGEGEQTKMGADELDLAHF